MVQAHSSKKPSGQPDYKRTDTAGLEQRPFPLPIRTCFRVYFEEDAYLAMMGHAQTTDEVELGGVLVGAVFHDAMGPYLWVVGSIPAEGAKNRDAQITFTQEAWRHINRVRDTAYPEHTIVGWYHTHPGHGVFLSEMDEFIQENFFNQPYQIAVVIETKTNKEGCFVWDNGKPTQIPRYWAGAREIALAGDETDMLRGNIPETDTERGPSVPRGWPQSGLLSNIALVALTLLILAIGHSTRETRLALRGQEEALVAVRGFLEAFRAEAAQDRTATAQRLSAIDGALAGVQTEAVQDRAATAQRLSAIDEALAGVQTEVAQDRAATARELSAIKEALERVHTEAAEQLRCIAELLGFLPFRLTDEFPATGLWGEPSRGTSAVPEDKPVAEPAEAGGNE